MVSRQATGPKSERCYVAAGFLLQLLHQPFAGTFLPAKSGQPASESVVTLPPLKSRQFAQLCPAAYFGHFFLSTLLASRARPRAIAAGSFSEAIGSFAACAVVGRRESVPRAAAPTIESDEIFKKSRRDVLICRPTFLQLAFFREFVFVCRFLLSFSFAAKTAVSSADMRSLPLRLSTGFQVLSRGSCHRNSLTRR